MEEGLDRSGFHLGPQGLQMQGADNNTICPDSLEPETRENKPLIEHGTRQLINNS